MNLFLSNKNQETPYTFTKVDDVFLSEAIDDGEVEKLIVDGNIETLDFKKIPFYIEFLAKKIAMGGTLTIVCVEPKCIFSAFYSGNLSIDNMNEFVFGSNNRCLVTAEYIRSVLEQIGLKIEYQQFFDDRGTFVIEAKKVIL